MSKIIGIDLGTTYGCCKYRRSKNNTVYRSIYEDWRASGRRAGKTSGSYQLRENHLFHQETYGN